MVGGESGYVIKVANRVYAGTKTSERQKQLIFLESNAFDAMTMRTVLNLTLPSIGEKYLTVK